MKSYIKLILESIFNDEDIVNADDIISSAILSKYDLLELIQLFKENISAKKDYRGRLKDVPIKYGENIIINKSGDNIIVNMNFDNNVTVYYNGDIPDMVQWGNVRCIEFCLLNATSLKNIPKDVYTLILSNYKGSSLLFDNNISYDKILLEYCHNITDLSGLNNIQTDVLYINYCNKLTTTKGIYDKIKVLNITDCLQLTSLEDLPKEMLVLTVVGCSELTSIENLNVETVNHIIIKDCSLRSLKGCPTNIQIDANFSSNLLTSLDCSSTRIGQHCYLTDNQLTSLENGPEYINRSLYINDNNLLSINGLDIQMSLNGIIYALGNSKFNSMTKEEILSTFKCLFPVGANQIIFDRVVVSL